MAVVVVPIVIVAGVVVAAASTKGGRRGGQTAPSPNPDRPGGMGGAEMLPLLGAGAKGIENVLTNKYQDNGNNGKPKCELFPYSERDKKCPKGMTDFSTNAHHAIPDHCWRTGGATQKTLNAGIKKYGETGTLPAKIIEYFGMESTQALDDVLPGGSYYDARMNKEKGLSICVTGKGKNLQHGAIHKAMDSLEDQLGAKGNPKYTATLKDMENAAAESISKVTGCDKQNLKDQLRKYHNDLGFTEPEKTLLRADSGGRNTSQWGKDPIIGRGSNTGGDKL